MADREIMLPSYAETPLEILHSKGYKGYIVGGCVRDFLLGKNPHDYDICTDCTPQEMKEVFSDYHTIETGIAHGTLTVMIEHQPIEITTFRCDGEYIDHRRPESVTFETEVSEDLKRRDFTVNALCYNEREGIIDLFDGRNDLKRKVIKCVGEPQKRFDEDALRILRALRFASVLGFSIEEKTAAQIHAQKNLLSDISAERIAVELKKLLCGKAACKILLEYRDVFAVIIPQLVPCFDFKQNNPHHCYDVYEHICHSVEYVRPDWVMRLTMLLHDIGKPKMHTIDENGVSHFKKHQFAGADMSVEILSALKLDTKSKKHIHDLIYEHDNRIPAERKSVKKFIAKYNFDFFMDYLEVRRADTYAQSDYLKNEKLCNLDELARLGMQIQEENCCLTRADLAINGNDLINAGFCGADIKIKLEKLLEAVINEEVPNNREKLLAFLDKFKQR